MNRILILLIAALGTFHLLQAQDNPADDADDTVQLGDVLVTASRQERRAETVPANVSIITRADIENSNATSVPDLLVQQAGINVRSFFGTNAASTSVDLGGFGEAAALNMVLLVDGVRSDFGDRIPIDWSAIPLNQVERIEIMRGGGTVLYGANATGGVINIITRAGGNRQVRGKVEVDSYGYSQMLNLSGQQDALGYSLTQGYTDGDGYRTNNYYRSKNGHLGLSLVPEDGWYEIQLRAGINDEDYGLPGPLSMAALNAGTVDRRDSLEQDNWATRESVYVTLAPTLHFNDKLRLEIPMTYRERDTHSVLATWGLTIDSRDITWGLAPQIVSEYELAGRPNTFSAGIDYYDTDKTSTFLDSRREVYGYFLNNSIEIVDNIHLDLGYRHGTSEYRFGGGNNKRFGVDAFRGGLAWNYQADSKLFALYDRSYRIGAVDDYFSVFSGLNDELEPQITKTTQLGIQHRFNQRLLGALTFFHVDTDNEIFYDPGTFSNTNYGETERLGFIAEIRTRLTDNLDLTASYTYIDAELGKNTGSDYDGNEVPLVPEQSVKGDLEYRFLDGFTWSLGARWVDRRHSESDWDNVGAQLDSYVVVDTRLAYNWKWLTVYGGINNIFEEEYSDTGIYSSFSGDIGLYPNPERTLFAGVDVTYRF